jgi:hypothetical protein
MAAVPPERNHGRRRLRRRGRRVQTLELAIDVRCSGAALTAAVAAGMSRPIAPRAPSGPPSRDYHIESARRLDRPLW